MRLIRKILIAAMVIVLLVAVFYFIFNSAEKSAAEKRPFADFRQNLQPKLLVENAAESIKKSFKRAGGGALSLIKENTSEAIDSFGERIGIAPTEDSENSVRPPEEVVPTGSGNPRIWPAAKMGEAVYFSILNPVPQTEVKYEIDWGDSTVQKGTLSGGSKTVSHTWNKEGLYSIVFKTSDPRTLSDLISVFVSR